MTAVRKLSRISKVAALSVALSPIFVTIPGGDILLLRLLRSDFAQRPMENAISVFALFMALAGLFVLPDFARAVQRKRPLFLAIVILCGYYILIGTVSALDDRDVYPLMAAAQYIFPVAVVGIGRLFDQRMVVDWQRILMLFIVMNLGLPLAVFGYISLVADRGNALFGALDLTNLFFYALLSHLPAVTLVACVLLLGIARSRLVVSFAVLSATIVLYMTWSRAAVLVFGVAIVVSIVCIIFTKSAGSRRGGRVLKTCALLLPLVLAVPWMGTIGTRAESRMGATIAEIPPGTSEREPSEMEAGQMVAPAAGRDGSWTTPTERVAAGGSESIEGQALRETSIPVRETSILEVSNTYRRHHMVEGLRRWLKHPWLGVMFTPDTDHLIRGQVIEKKQVFQSHNQYIDLLLKTGMVGFTLTVAFYCIFVFLPLIRVMRSERHSLELVRYCCLMGALVGLLVGANFQNYFTVWTTALPLSFLIGSWLGPDRTAAERNV